jgi:hypothetical protein
MSIAELISSVQYVVNANGDKKAVVLELAVWEKIRDGSIRA